VAIARAIGIFRTGYTKLKPHTESLAEFGKTSSERLDKAVQALRAGRPVVLVDDEGRENEGDLVLAAENVTADSINFMIRHGSGIVCLTLTEEQADKLDLGLMVPKKSSNSNFVAAFTVSIEAKEGVTTGVSAADRAHTIRTAVNERSTAVDLSRPGHVFPLRARDGGVLVRPGHTEGSVDLAKIAGLKPAGVVCELMNPDGTMSRMPEIIEFAREHQLTVLSIPDIISFQMANQTSQSAGAMNYSIA
jgi:3,4-dihydroxy 2-butanone 4-phosphate synthase/GTP cyclohydrolase II